MTPVALCRVDKVAQCVSAAPMLQGLFVYLGFKELWIISAEGDEEDPKGVKTPLTEAK